MKASQFRKLIREEVRKVVRESKSTNTRKRKLNELTVKPDPNDEVSGSSTFDFDKFAKKCPVVLSSGDWFVSYNKQLNSMELIKKREENPKWDRDFIPLQNYLYTKYVDGTDFGLMISKGDDIFNALAIKNLKILQDPTVKKYIKKIMSYGGLELEKGSI
jgi:hypothetical protein